MVQGFDIGIDTTGEMILDSSIHDILSKEEEELRLQLTYNRIKSVTENWFRDEEVGANLESLIGRPCNVATAENGKNLISHQLLFDKLWDEKEFFIKCTINNMINLVYNIYFKIEDKETDDTFSYEIIAEIDLVKGVKIRYGWEPKYDRIKH
jgi:hypothetical protein